MDGQGNQKRPLKLLLNGCSFCANYNDAAKLGWRLGIPEFVNLARGGSSNRRIIRTTMDHILDHEVDFVMIGLTFYDRQEGALLDLVPHEDNWVSYNARGLQGVFAPNDAKFYSGTSRYRVENYIEDRYRYDINPRYMDQLICDILMFSAWLDQQGIRHLIWNTCEKHFEDYFDFVNGRYRSALAQNKHIVPVMDFVSNEYLFSQGATYDVNEEQWPVHARHYNGHEYRHVNEYLLNYIQNNQL